MCANLFRREDYLTRPYFDQWMQVYAAMMVDSGCGQRGRDRPRQGDGRSPISASRWGPVDVAGSRVSPADFRRPATQAPAFAVGDKRAHQDDRRHGHTRLPAYAMGKTGIVEAYRGNHLLPDAGARGREAAPNLSTTSPSRPPICGRRQRAAATASSSICGRAILSAADLWRKSANRGPCVSRMASRLLPEPWQAETWHWRPPWSRRVGLRPCAGPMRWGRRSASRWHPVRPVRCRDLLSMRSGGG